MNDIEIATKGLGSLVHAGPASAIFRAGFLDIDDRLAADEIVFAPFGHGAESDGEKERLLSTVWCGERAYWQIVEGARRTVVGSAPATGACVVVAVPAAPSVSGVNIIKAGFSTEECERINVARGDEGRSDWARAIVLDVIRSGRAVPPVCGAGSKPSYLNFRLSGPDAAALDKARGLAARAAFVRAAILAACG